MSILSVSLTPDIEEFIKDEISAGEYESKGQLVKKALKKLREETIINRILKASNDAKDGKVFRGDLKPIARKLK